MKSVSILAALAAALVLASCAQIQQDPWDVGAVRALADPEDPILARKAEGYIGLAEEERAEGDWDDVEFFLNKARALKSGKNLGPQMVSTRTIEDPVAKAELEKALADYLAFPVAEALHRAPEHWINAQVLFDCWLQEQEEGHQQADIDNCKIAFYEAFKSLSRNALLREEVFVLLEGENGKVGKLIVSAGGTNVTLETANAAAQADTGGQATPVDVLNNELDRIFGNARAFKPIAPKSFTLYFEFDEADLIPESAALISKIVEEVKKRPVAEIEIIGHTDTMGTTKHNEKLSKERSRRISTLLVQGGVIENFIRVENRGESELSIATNDNVREERNRRVEIEIR